MNKMQAFGAGFPLEFSSCSNIKPKLFEWSADSQDIRVFIDSAIPTGLTVGKNKSTDKKIAWVCESRAIFHLMYPKDMWEKNLSILCESYDEIYVTDRQWCSHSDKIKFAFAGSNLPWIPIVDKIPEKTKLVSMVASPKKMTFGHHIRHIMAEKYKNNIDLYGGASGSPRVGFGQQPWPDKTETLLPYMFHIVIENDKYETYFTEKITDCFASGTIPVYWGAPDIGKYFNMNGIIQLTPEFDISALTPELYYSKLAAVNDNLNRVRNLETADDILYRLITKQ
jgi:hypothetical protein